MNASPRSWNTVAAGAGTRGAVVRLNRLGENIMTYRSETPIHIGILRPKVRSAVRWVMFSRSLLKADLASRRSK